MNLPGRTAAAPDQQDNPSALTSSEDNVVLSGQTPYTISVKINKTNDGFGFSVAWTRPPRVERVENGRAAANAGLKAGDYIIFVGNHNVVKLDENAVLKIIRDCGDQLSLEVYRRGVSRTPKTLLNGWARPPPLSNSDSQSNSGTYDALKRNKIGQVTFGNENFSSLMQEKLMCLLTAEERFCFQCQFGVERYLIPLKFRTDLLTVSNHSKLFSTIEGVLDLTDAVRNPLTDASSENRTYDIGSIYDNVIDSLVQDYGIYFKSLPQAEKILSQLLQEPDFIDFLRHPVIPKRKPDITTFIHLPGEHIREVIGILEEILLIYPDKLHNNFTSLRDVKEKFTNVYRKATTDQNIMEPNRGSTSPGPHLNGYLNRNMTPIRRPLVTTRDIEARLVFTRNAQPFKLTAGNRQWLFGSELSIMEGKQPKAYWAMLFSDLILFTAINRDRVIFVVEDPVPLANIIGTVFNVKKKATEFRLVIEMNRDLSTGYIVGKGSTRNLEKSFDFGTTSSRSSTLNRGRTKKMKSQNRQTMILRAPSVEVKSTWENLLRRQIYLCQSRSFITQDKVHGIYTPSLLRASSQEGRTSHDGSDIVLKNRSESCDDLRPSWRNSNYHQKKEKKEEKAEEEVEELLLLIAPEEEKASHSAAPSSPKEVDSRAVSKNYPSVRDSPASVPVITVNDFEVGIKTEKKTLNKDGKNSCNNINNNNKISRENNSGFNINNISSQDTVKYSPKKSEKEKENTDDGVRIEIEEDPEDEYQNLDKIRLAQRKKPKKKKSFTGKFKEKLFAPKKPLPKKKVNKAKKVESYVDSLAIHGNDVSRSVTPLFEHEDKLKEEDFMKKREEMLNKKKHKRNNYEVTEIMILEDGRSVSPSPDIVKRLQITPNSSPEPVMEDRSSTKRSELEVEKKPALVLEVIENKPLESKKIDKPSLVTPEEYEEYLDGEIEKDYPELKSIGASTKSVEEETFIPDTQISSPKSHKVEVEVHEELVSPTNKNAFSPRKHQEHDLTLNNLESVTTQPIKRNVDPTTPDNNIPDTTDPLSGMAEKRGLKSYGSSCDLSKFGISSPSDNEDPPIEESQDHMNGNLIGMNNQFASSKLSKIGGTRSGQNVAKKLAVFEQVAQEERVKYLKCQEARMRIAGKPFRHSGEYINRFYQPPNPDVLRVQEKDYSSYNEMKGDSYLEYARSPSPFLFRSSNNSSRCTTHDGNESDSDEEFKNDPNCNNNVFSRQSTNDSVTTMRKKEEEVIDLLERSYREDESPSPDFSLDLPDDCEASESSPKCAIKSSLKKTSTREGDPGQERRYSRQSFLTEDSLTSPSRVRFSPVTDVYFRDDDEEAYYSSSGEDPDYGGQRWSSQGAAKEEEDDREIDNFVIEDEDDSDQFDKMDVKKDLGATTKISPERSISKSFASSDEGIVKMNDSDKSGKGKKRFGLFRGAKKEEPDSTFMVKALKGKKPLFRRSKASSRSIDDNQRKPTYNEPESDEEFM